MVFYRSPDEVEMMREIGNAKADKLYGSSRAMASLPPDDAPHNQWLEFFRDKYERRRWAESVEVQNGSSKCVEKSNQTHPSQKKVATEDLLGLQHLQATHASPQPGPKYSGEDFFAQFDL